MVPFKEKNGFAGSITRLSKGHQEVFQEDEKQA